jgi:hypothetical protein
VNQFKQEPKNESNKQQLEYLTQTIKLLKYKPDHHPAVGGSGGSEQWL